MSDASPNVVTLLYNCENQLCYSWLYIIYNRLTFKQPHPYASVSRNRKQKSSTIKRNLLNNYHL